MTDREAIVELNLLQSKYSEIRKSDVVWEAIETAKEALQEREERSKGCEYCRDDCCPQLDWRFGLDHILPDYMFCPMCGRQMKGADK